MTSEQKHTPGPWMPSASPTWSHCIYNKDGCVAQGNDPYSIVKNSELATANAAFIITACNSHYELLEALKTVLGQIEEGLPFHCTENNRKFLEQAISKAQGETR